MSITFDVGDDLQAIVDAVHGFATDKIRPRLREFEEKGGLSDDLMGECHELGLTTLALPEALGGSDLLDIRAACLCSEELAWGDVGVAVAIPGPRSAAMAVLELGAPEQKERLLRPFTRPDGAKLRGSLAWVEGPFGVDPAAIETTARKDGDAWVLDGTKRYVQSAGQADLTLVLARDASSKAASPWDRLALFAVEGAPAGFTARERDKTLGLHTSRTATVDLKGVRVPAGNRLGTGEPGEMLGALRRTIARKKVIDAARLVGCVRAASEYTFKYATEREAFGVKLFEHQALAFMMADMATEVEGLRTLVWHAAWTLDRGEEGYVEAMRAHDQASEVAVQVTSDAVQVLGGHGYLWDHPVEKWMRDARTLGVIDGLYLDGEEPPPHPLPRRAGGGSESGRDQPGEGLAMIDFELNGRMLQARDMAHMFAETYVRPFALEADVLEGPHPKFVEACKQFGLGTGQAGALTGGGGKKTKKEDAAPGEPEKKRVNEANRMMILASEELAWGDATAALNLPGPGLGGPPVQFTGTPAQRERFLGLFKPDEFKFGAYALTEPGAGSDAKNIRTTCRKDGDHWVLDGSKIYITNGKKAEWSVVFATMDRSLGRAGHRAFVVEKGTPGFTVPKVEKKMGLKASETAEQVFVECRVPADNLLGGEAHYERAGKGGFTTAMKTFDATRPIVAVMAVGIARAAYEIARDWVRSSYPLSQHTARYRRVADTLAWMEREIHMARLLCWKAAWMLDLELPNSKESSMSKAYAGAMVQKVTAKAIEVLGPEGVLHHRLIEKLYRDQKVYDIFEGTGQIQRLVISRRLFETK